MKLKVTTKRDRSHDNKQFRSYGHDITVELDGKDVSDNVMGIGFDLVEMMPVVTLTLLPDDVELDVEDPLTIAELRAELHAMKRQKEEQGLAADKVRLELRQLRKQLESK